MASRSVLVNGNRAATFLTAPEPARVGAVSCSQVRGRASRYQSRAIGMLDGGAAASSGKTLRILLVDDSPADRELVKRAFREPAPPTGPLDLEVVTDAEAALTAVRKATFAVILTDYSLPGRNGLELLRALRETGDKTPVVMMTGLGDESVAVAALQHGAADYVIKEIGFERALPVVIDRVLGKRTLALEVERRQRQVAQYAKQSERQVEDQTVALRRALQESEALRRVSRALAAARELKPALDLVTQATAQLLRARAAAVIIRAEAERVLVSVWGALKEAPGLKSADLLAALGTDFPETATGVLRGEGGAEIGLLWAGRSAAQAFSPHDLELLEVLADLATLSIANVRAHQQLRRRAERDRIRGGTAEAAGRPGAGPPPARLVSPEPVDTSALVVPPFPAALGRLLALAEGDDATPDEVAKALGLDPALATRAIVLAGAPGLGRARPVSSLREAVMVLGLRGIRNLAIAQFPRRLLVRSGVINHLPWERSVATAVGTQLTVETRERAVADEAYLCGLLHNVGAVALNNAHPERYARAIGRAIAEERPFGDAEREAFGFDGATATERVVSSWSLPARVVETLRNRPWSAGPIDVPLKWASTAALQMSPTWHRLLGDRPEPSWVRRELEAAESALALLPAALEELRRQTVARCEVLRNLVG